MKNKIFILHIHAIPANLVLNFLNVYDPKNRLSNYFSQ